MSIGIFALLVTPTVWVGYSVIQNTESSTPTAGPIAQNISRGQGVARTRGVQNGFQGFAGAFNGSAQTDATLISFLEAHQDNTKFLVATTNANTAAPIILATNWKRSNSIAFFLHARCVEDGRM